MATKSKKFAVVHDPELIRLSRGFIPEFGNDDDLAIINRMHSLDKLLEKVDNAILRGGQPDKLTKKMKDILFFESGLKAAITRRIMDF